MKEDNENVRHDCFEYLSHCYRLLDLIFRFADERSLSDSIHWNFVLRNLRQAKFHLEVVYHAVCETRMDESDSET